MTMLEKAAKAAWESGSLNTIYKWEELSEDFRMATMDHYRVFLEAIREPDEEMIRIAEDMNAELGDPITDRYAEPDDVWTAWIDYIINQGVNK